MADTTTLSCSNSLLNNIQQGLAHLKVIIRHRDFLWTLPQFSSSPFSLSASVAQAAHVVASLSKVFIHTHSHNCYIVLSFTTNVGFLRLFWALSGITNKPKLVDASHKHSVASDVTDCMHS